MTCIGYLMNIYPVTSATFIRREIRALEAQGVTVNRYAIRRWSEALVDDNDQQEQTRTHYLLSGRSLELILDFFREALSNPLGLARALMVWGTLLWTAKSGIIRHVAYLLEAISLKRQMQRDQVAHLHAHFSTNTAAVALLAHKLGGPGYSFTAHGPDEFIDWGPSSLRLKVTEARFVIAISKYCRTQLTLAAGQSAWDKIHIVRCGVQTDEFMHNKAPFEATSPFVCVGRLCPQKAQVLIVEAIAQVAADYPNIRIRLIGDGESRADVEAAIARHAMQDNVELLGWQNNAQVRDVLGHARALVLPSFAEGLPVVIMEAMALGRPVISSFIAGIPELVDNSNGWIIPAGSVEDIVAALRQAMVAKPSMLKKLGQAGRQRVIADHDVEKNAAQLRAIIENATQKADAK
jgi:colanic acid/amylovoran biosynthesis glycosyltransferase